MTHRLKTRASRALLHGLAVAALGVTVGCHDILKVQDPQNFASGSLDNPILWPSLANGAEGDLQLQVSSFAIFTGMLSDELWDSSTWIDWHDVSTGAIRANWATNGAWSATMDGILRARYSAQATATRFAADMKDTANTSPLMVQVKAVDAWSDLVLAMGFCEAPATQGSATVSDTVMFQNALTKLTAVLALAQAAHYTPAQATTKATMINWMNAGIARANLMLGKYDAAIAAAQLVPTGFEKDAIYSANTTAQNNQLFFQGNFGSNRSYTIRNSWYAQIDTVQGFLLDWYSGQLDTRVPLNHDNNNKLGYNNGAGGTVRFFSNGKANSAASPVAMAKYTEMLLIQAEANWRKGDNNTAVSFLNTNRALASLPAITLPTTGDVNTWVRDAILSERFATLYTEGFRLQDIYRFGLVAARVGTGRATKLPLSRTEETNNSNIGIGHGKCPAVS
jgi:hypothetical protein